MFYLDLQITNMGKQANRTTGCLRTMVSFSDFVRLPLLTVIMQINSKEKIECMHHVFYFQTDRLKKQAIFSYLKNKTFYFYRVR